MAQSDLVMTKTSKRFQKRTKHAQFLIPPSRREEGGREGERATVKSPSLTHTHTLACSPRPAPERALISQGVYVSIKRARAV